MSCRCGKPRWWYWFDSETPYIASVNRRSRSFTSYLNPRNAEGSRTSAPNGPPSKAAVAASNSGPPDIDCVPPAPDVMAPGTKGRTPVPSGVNTLLSNVKVGTVVVPSPVVGDTALYAVSIRP